MENPKVQPLENDRVRLLFTNRDRPAPLTDDELARIRKMLASSETICSGCPMARHLTGGDR